MMEDENQNDFFRVLEEKLKYWVDPQKVNE